MKFFTLMFIFMTAANCLLKMDFTYRYKMAASAGTSIQFLNALIYLYIAYYLMENL